MDPHRSPSAPEQDLYRGGAGSMGAAAALEELKRLAAACGQCQRCGLADSRRQVVVGRGNPAARLLLIGEAPGAEEDASGQPFVGRAGKLLEQLLAEAGLDSERDLYIANVIKCRPPGNRKPSRAEIAACIPWLERQIALQRPALIGLLGATALEALLGLKGGITKRRGQWLELREGRPQPIKPAQAAQPQPTDPSTTRPTNQPIIQPSIQSLAQATIQFTTQSTTQLTINPTAQSDNQQQGRLPPRHPSDSLATMRSSNFLKINLRNIAFMPLLHPSYLLRNPSELEGNPKWLTMQDFKEMRRKLDELGAG